MSSSEQPSPLGETPQTLWGSRPQHRGTEAVGQVLPSGPSLPSASRSSTSSQAVMEEDLPGRPHSPGASAAARGAG